MSNALREYRMSADSEGKPGRDGGGDGHGGGESQGGVPPSVSTETLHLAWAADGPHASAAAKKRPGSRSPRKRQSVAAPPATRRGALPTARKSRSARALSVGASPRKTKRIGGGKKGGPRTERGNQAKALPQPRGGAQASAAIEAGGKRAGSNEGGGDGGDETENEAENGRAAAGRIISSASGPVGQKRARL